MKEGGNPSVDTISPYGKIIPEEGLRQHPIKIVEDLLIIAIFSFFLSFYIFISISGGDSFMEEYAVWISFGLFSIIILSALWIFYWRWKKTIIKFKQTEVTMFRDTVFKKEVRIAYTKIASTNVNRGIINRITGTSKLMININSRVNTVIPELVMTFDMHLTDIIRKDLAAKIRGEVFVESGKDMPSIVRVTGSDIILHSLFSQPTASSLFGVAMFAIGMFELTALSGDSVTGVIALFMFLLTYAIPVITTMFHYYNYRIYKSDDTIYISHGLIRTYYKSFKTSKINAVRLRSPLIPRLFGRYMLDAEVVGLSGGDGNSNDVAPLLCPMKDKATIDNVMKILTSEFVFVNETKFQPREARIPVYIRATIQSSILVTIMFIIYNLAEFGTGLEKFSVLFTAITVLLAVSPFIYGIWNLKVLSLGKDSDVFMFVNGVADRKKIIVKYDKVQIITLSAGPISRPFGLAKGNVEVLSSLGSHTIYSGYFRFEDINSISEEVIARINDGRYDYGEYT